MITFYNYFCIFIHYFITFLYKKCMQIFERSLLSYLNSRLSENKFDPAFITGVKGCGKSTLAGQFAKRFAQNAVYDLSEAPDRQAFDQFRKDGLHFSPLLRYRNRDPFAGRTLLLIDNVHRSPGIWQELLSLPQRPANLFLLGAGNIAPEGISTTPDTLQLLPLSFAEFLAATGETEALASYLEVPCPDYAHPKLLSLFHRYVIVGGMPEAVSAWVSERNMIRVDKVFDAILSGWVTQLSRHIRGKKSALLASTLLSDAFSFAAARIRFRHFANHPVGSREGARAFRSLEEMMFLRLIFPTTAVIPDAPPDTGRAPRLQFADTGMVVYLSGIRHPVTEAGDLTRLVGGQILRHVAGQEIMSADVHSHIPGFWIREKVQSKAEVDFVISYNGLSIPVVTRTGEPGRLRSLHSFLDAAPHPFAVRLCGERLNVKTSTTLNGKTFYLLSLPYYLAGKIKEHLDGFVKYVG